jgi:ribosomal protein S18 acetylase RimI-like enzyme
VTDSPPIQTDFDRIYEGTDSHHVITAMREVVGAHGPSLIERQPEVFLNSAGEGFGRRELSELHHWDLAYDFERISELLLEEYDAEFGPKLALRGPRTAVETIGDAVIVVADFDDLGLEDELRLYDSVYEEFYDSSLHRAALAYRRACGWDFSPGAAGAWILYCVPISVSGGVGEWSYSANLAGFVVLHDRRADGEWSIAHLWTARTARRRGVARRLIEEARKRLNVTWIEGPVTDDGRALIEAAAPDLATWRTH